MFLKALVGDKTIAFWLMDKEMYTGALGNVFSSLFVSFFRIRNAATASSGSRSDL
jgi:hypothetical protein